MTKSLVAMCLLLVSLAAACGTGDSEGKVTPSTSQLEEVARQIFPETAPQSGIFIVCGANLAQLANCPVTERLRSRLTDLRMTLCRCQNGSGTRTIRVNPQPGGGTADVTLFDGSYVFRLVIVEEEGRLLVDDETCGPSSGGSIYTDPVGSCAIR